MPQLRLLMQRYREAEACTRQSALGPSIVDGREMPLDDFRGSVAIKLIAHID